MSREREGYRENLSDILEYFGGKRVLTVADVKKYTGITDYRTLKKRYPFDAFNTISAATLAMKLVGGDVQ